jgi:hypothetical protein
VLFVVFIQGKGVALLLKFRRKNRDMFAENIIHQKLKKS